MLSFENLSVYITDTKIKYPYTAYVNHILQYIFDKCL